MKTVCQFCHAPIEPNADRCPWCHAPYGRIEKIGNLERFEVEVILPDGKMKGYVAKQENIEAEVESYRDSKGFLCRRNTKPKRVLTIVEV